MCFYPKQALRLSSKTKKGKSVIKFISQNDANKFKDNPNLLTGLPCGQCIDCRLNRSRMWAIRCVHESQLYNHNCFITLTYNDESLTHKDNPKSLVKRDFQLFMKRLRKEQVNKVYKSLLGKFIGRFSKKLLYQYAKYKVPKIRYYMCGEYGELTKRPHYHACIFNYDFKDKEIYRIKDGIRLYTSNELSRIWSHGFCTVGSLNYDTAAYTARYIMKKHLGKDAWKNYYEYIDEQTGELVGHRIPEYTTMSRRSGIGKEWLNKYLTDVYTSDRVFLRGRGFMKPPKYYDSIFEHINPSKYEIFKQARIDEAKKHANDNTPDRLSAKQVVKLAQIKILKRELE